MSETAETKPVATETDAATEQTADQSAAKPTDTVEFWKQKAREQEKRAKENADAAKRLADFEESQKSESQKIADRAASAERERDEARAEGVRYKAAAKHGIGEDWFDMLGSGDEDTISGRAERIGGLLKIQAENEQLKAENEALKQGKSPTATRPIASLKPGATAEQVTEEKDDSYPSHWLPNRQQ